MADENSAEAETSVTPGGATPGGGLAPGTLLNGIYRIEERLGAGGMGEVYRATNIANDDQDAIKIIGRGLANQATMEAMFRKEARVLRRIQSPAVAQLRLFARDPALDALYFVTEFVAGVSLLDRLKQRPASADELRQLIARVATGLQAVHDAGAVHRDLSPDNIILPGGDVAEAKLIDFGIVKELDPGQVSMIGDSFAGKFGYIAPEQLGFSNSRIGPWTDLYSLALVGLAFAAGKASYMGSTMGTADEARRREIDLSPLPDDLKPLFRRMLCYDWRERVSSASAVLAMLDVADADATVVSRPPPVAVASSPPTPVDPTPAGPVPAAFAAPIAAPVELSVPPAAPAPRRWRWVMIGGIVGLLALVALATWWWMAPPPFAAPGVPVQHTGSGLAYQVLAPGAGGARPGPGDVVVLRVRRHVPGESDAGVGSVLVEALRPERMWVGQIEAVRLMTKGERLMAWVPPPLRGPTAGGSDTTPGGRLATLDMELIEFGRVDSPVLQARLAELGQQLPSGLAPPAAAPAPAATPSPVATPSPAPAPSETPSPLPGPTRAAPGSSGGYDFVGETPPPPRPRPTRAPRPAPAPADSGTSEGSVGKGRTDSN